ncbi:EamA family transporter [Aerosticca soli]|jgi:drug/metabolite transporter (DMT)-like permease|uniref:Permease of the drug/metabolite transporter superfamily n=1 Tax=Aerosticca soli TaxID=2010829 RepID=A0A2Z6E640_9GAMM|nr:EamA family transporter [Aerosticca soli]MDI3262322.1 EamA family transporter [Fulvimonas sp.]BBD80221.1 permease of the drug/metabolite transporter superfamily [Aerosticca soli]
MQPLALGLWMANATLDTCGQLAFKAAANTPAQSTGIAHWQYMLKRPWLWLGITCYIAEFFAWIAFLSLLPLSEGVLLGSINIVIVMLAGRLFFGERLTPMRVTGILLVSLGVLLVGSSA